MATPVLCLHGMQDNCETFDRLIPLLNPCFYFICIDLPGHGHSSHFSSGFRITLENYMLAVKRVIDHLKLNKFKCIGHSMGGMTASIFASIYPEFIESLVMIDCAGPESVHPQDTVQYMRKLCDNLLTLESKIKSGSPPSYTYEELINKLMTLRPSKLTRQSADVLIKRSLKEHPNGRYSFITDQRLKINYNLMFSPAQQMEIIFSIKCPVLYLHATENQLQKNIGNKLVRKMYKYNPNVQVIKVNGNHDVHLNHPERISNLINTFLLSSNSKI